MMTVMKALCATLRRVSSNVPLVPKSSNTKHTRVGEWEEWWGHRFTKKKAKTLWIGWQVKCAHHTACTRPRALGVDKQLPRDSEEALQASERVQRSLKSWAVQSIDFDHSKDHMGIADERNPPPDEELEALGQYAFMVSTAQSAVVAPPVAAVARETSSSPTSGSSSSSSTDSEGSDTSD